MRATAILICVALFLVAGAASAHEASASPNEQADCPGNMLTNPGFEGGSRKTDNLGTSLSSAVADGWVPWFVRGSESENREPEFKVEQTAIGGDPFRVRSGANSQKWFTTWATHDAGVYQQVSVRPGVPVTFSAYGMVYTGEGDGWSGSDRTYYSDPVKPGEYRIWVGIDPTGAVPAGMGSPPPASVVWSEESMATDQFVPLSVSVVPQSSTITVYFRGNPHWGVKHNDSFWDDACLRAGGSPAQAQQVAQPAEAPAPEATAPTAGDGAEEAAPAEEEEAAVAPEPVRAADNDGAQAPPPSGQIVPPRRQQMPRWSPLPPVPGKQWAVPL
ncbi:MAG: hypothetical protein ACK2UL_02825 [Anaerolineae bacterium]